MSKNILVAGIFISCFVFYDCRGQQQFQTQTISDPDNWVRTTRDSLHIKTFRGDGLTSKPNLVIIIHGDAPFNNPGYQYRLAKMISDSNRNTVSIGLLRPGYTDPENNRSPGQKGLTTGDNYTPEIIDDIAAAIKNLQNLYHPSNTIIAGHSGGSAITADIINRYPGIANAAVIVSCPCNLPVWRAHMKSLQKNKIWDQPVTSLSPHEQVRNISRKTKVVVITGEKDDVAPTELSYEYYELLKKNNIEASLITVKNEGHEIFLSDSVRKTISGFIVK